MKYYKQTLDDGTVIYHKRETEIDDDSFDEITEAEYITAIEKLRAEAQEVNESSAEQEKDDRIAELEKENASLKSELISVRASLNTIKKEMSLNGKNSIS